MISIYTLLEQRGRRGIGVGGALLGIGALGSLAKGMAKARSRQNDEENRQDHTKRALDEIIPKIPE